MCNIKIDLKKHHDSHNKSTQFGQAGVLHKIFETIGTTNKYFVEFGSDGTTTGQGNSYCLRKIGFDGLLMDAARNKNAVFDVKKHLILSSNINQLFEKYDVPESFDFLSIDIDNNDWYVWNALSDKYKPRVVSIETSRKFSPELDIVAPEKQERAKSNHHCYLNYGCSVTAAYNLGRKKGYFYVAHCGVDAIFINEKVVDYFSNIEWVNMNNISEIYTKKTNEKYVPKKYNTSIELMQ